ncbi:hypothetical protein GCM10010198_42970 [Nocardia seriolae]|nr:hypothetical protein NSERKGN1266_61790 [Nocardia seriolae]BEK93941.1 hypothetical protein NSER024013_18470 [Nocardia seriolae]GEM28348.1 hypothetical protein NS2_65870 [Nocardia seriolae NBRC 15557]
MSAELSSVLAHPATRATASAAADDTSSDVRRRRWVEEMGANVFRVEAVSRTGMERRVQALAPPRDQGHISEGKYDKE